MPASNKSRVNRVNMIRFIVRKDFFVKSRKNNIKEHYKFEKILGKGAFGTVYLARASFYPHEKRAIKVINKEKVKNHQTLIDQVNILKELDHPSIIKIYETYENEKHLCIVLDYCEGGELYDKMEESGSFSEKDARIIFAQMVKTVKYLHVMKVCHRDLKLQNFLMHKNDSLDIKLIDFGLSKKWNTNLKQELKASGMNKIVGTTYYMAPEVIEKSYTQQCDIWSLGVLLYILVTGSPPFDGCDDNDMFKAIVKGELSMTKKQTIRLSLELKDLLSKILVRQGKRLTIEEIMNHPWMKKEASTKPLQINAKGIREFAKFTRLKKVVMTYIASQLPEGSIHELGEQFKKADKDLNGLLTMDEVQEILAKQNTKITGEEIKQLFEYMDSDRNGKINYNEFISACLDAAKYMNEQFLTRVFEYFDQNNDGTISVEEFKEILNCKDVNYQFNSKAVAEIIEEIDSNNDGVIDYHQFLRNMKIG